MDHCTHPSQGPLLVLGHISRLPRRKLNQVLVSFNMVQVRVLDDEGMVAGRSSSGKGCSAEG